MRHKREREREEGRTQFIPKRRKKREHYRFHSDTSGEDSHVRRVGWFLARRKGKICCWRRIIKNKERAICHGLFRTVSSDLVVSCTTNSLDVDLSIFYTYRHDLSCNTNCDWPNNLQLCTLHIIPVIVSQWALQAPNRVISKDIFSFWQNNAVPRPTRSHYHVSARESTLCLTRNIQSISYVSEIISTTESKKKFSYSTSETWPSRGAIPWS